MPHVSERTEKIAAEVLAAALDWTIFIKKTEDLMSEEEITLFDATEKFRNEGGVSLAGELIMVESKAPQLISGRVSDIVTKPPSNLKTKSSTSNVALILYIALIIFLSYVKITN